MKGKSYAVATANVRRQQRQEKNELAALLERMTELVDEISLLRPLAQKASSLALENEKYKEDIDRLHVELREEHSVVRDMDKVCEEFYRHNEKLYKRLSLFFDCLEYLPLTSRRQFFEELDKRESVCELPPIKTNVCRVSAFFAS